MAVFTTLSVVFDVVFYGHSGDFCHTCLYFHHAVWWKSPYGYSKFCNIDTHKTMNTLCGAKGINKINFTMLYGNYWYIIIENFPQKFSPCMLYRICTRAHTGLIQQSLSPIYGIWKISVPLCMPRTSGHPSEYWPSAKLLALGDSLEPDTYHTPNAVGH